MTSWRISWGSSIGYQVNFLNGDNWFIFGKLSVLICNWWLIEFTGKMRRQVNHLGPRGPNFVKMAKRFHHTRKWCGTQRLNQVLLSYCWCFLCVNKNYDFFLMPKDFSIENSSLFPPFSQMEFLVFPILAFLRSV